MKTCRNLTGIISLLGLHALAASPASAAVAAGNSSSGLSFGKATVLSSNIDAAKDGCRTFIAPALGATTPGSDVSPGASKAAAILGGRVSQLELIARQQASLAAQPAMTVADSGARGITPAAAQELPGTGLEPAAGGLPCPALARARTSPFAASPGLGRTPLGREDFLASKRLPVSRTAFDPSWGRVRAGQLPKGWRKWVAGSRPASNGAGPSSEGIADVNRWVNDNVRYVEDRQLYGQADYWASARTTLQRRAGDCEDIAIAKMQLLAAMGVARDDMYLTIARDLARNADHALLVVRLEDRFVLLDNATNDVLDARESYDYRPIMSFSTAGKWLHGY